MQIDMTNPDTIEAGKQYARDHGRQAWVNLCEAWGMDQDYSQRVKDIFLAGLAMGFVEGLRAMRDTVNAQSIEA
jgi:hypothetical protein